MQNKGLLLVFSTAIISGVSVFINKFGVGMNNPDIFTFAKNTAVAVLFTAVIFFLKDRKALFQLNKNQWLQLLALGLIGGSIPFLLFFKGLALTSAAQGAFIHKTMFIFVVILAAFILKEKINKNFIIGGLLLLLGNLILLKGLHFSFGLGDALVLVAVLFWAMENVLAKYVLREMPGNIAAWGRMFFGSIFILAYLSFTGQASQVLNLNSAQIGWIAITSALLFGYTITWYNGLKTVSVSIATTILLFGLPITTALSAIYAGKITPQDAWSMILLLLGVFIIVSFPPRIKRGVNWKRESRILDSPATAGRK
ncbi:MAG: DMT family transporter [Candidatus Portnoybacteria bacterium]|nr:DMT family transporter [Candidatus Portnoybacteria bacterium]MDD4983160.1 DMT family transporter [Candidatus Portnoybacteria bacterium]